jgi:Fe-S cluster assembly ATPase SufC
MIESLELENFKSHRHTEFHFDSSRLHAIVGQNGSGKTSTLKALWSLSDIFGKERGIPFDSSWRSPRAPNGLQLPKLFTTLREQETIVTGVYSNTKYSTDSLEEWCIAYKGKDEVTGLLKSGNSINEKAWLEIIKSTIPLKLIASNLARPSYSEKIAPVIKASGEDLASALDYLRDEDPDRFDRLQAMLRQVVPIVKGISLRRAQLDIDHQRTIEIDGKSIAYTDSQPVMGKEVVFNMATGDRLPASVVSEGTVLTLGILSILMSPQQPKIILIDDVEQGLHPKAQRELMQVFKEIIKAHPDLQIIFTTHSPYIIDALEPSQVHVLGTGTDGFTHTKRLDEHPDAEWAKQTLTTGEFWDAEGEDWVMSGEVHD